jgi:uncharacterized protein YjiS (DUF1127 family)
MEVIMTAARTIRAAARTLPRRLGVLARVLGWLDLATQRRHLAELDERMLRDIGLRREDALAEARRPFWDAPR